MELNYKEVLGFKFVKVGDFVISDTPHPVTFDGKQDHINVCIELVDDLFLKSDESAYLIYVEDELVYVGEFSYSLKDRWFRRKTYIWHNTDVDIEEQLRFPNFKKVSLWLTVQPYMTLNDSYKMNISKSIEQEILRQIMPPWNTRGQMKKWSDWRAKNCIPVSNIICKINNKNHEPMIVPSIELFECAASKDSAGVEGIVSHTVPLPRATGDIPEPSKIDDHLEYITDTSLQSIFNIVRQKIMETAPNAEEYPTKNYVGYKCRGRLIAWIKAYHKSFEVGVAKIGEKREKLSEGEVRITTGDDGYAEILEDIKKSYLNLEKL